MNIQILIETFIPEGVNTKTDFEYGQMLVAIVRIPGRFFGTNSKRYVLDSEVIPAWAVIQRNALGSSDWRSKFAKYGYFGSKRVSHGVFEVENPDLEAVRRDYRF